MKAEEVLFDLLALRLGSLVPGVRHRIMLMDPVFDGITSRRGPHVIGWIERSTVRGIRFKLLDTMAGREARALLEEDLLDVSLSHDRPPIVRLTSATLT